MIEKIRTFFSEVGTELRKVSWPTRRETVNVTVAVVVLMLILGAFLAIVDGLLAKMVSLILG